jgi:hypothetical protein
MALPQKYNSAAPAAQVWPSRKVAIGAAKFRDHFAEAPITCLCFFPME